MGLTTKIKIKILTIKNQTKLRLFIKYAKEIIINA
jgi:hypothetical protein